MGVLVAAIGTFITQLIAQIAGVLSKKALVVAFLATYAVIVVAFIALLNGLLARLVTSAPSGTLIRAGLDLMPSNTGVCIGIIGAAYAARWVFIWKLSLIKALIQS